MDNELEEFPEKEELSNIAGWVHLNPEILKMGRVSYHIPKTLDEDAQEELKGKYEEKDPITERLRSCTEDNRKTPKSIRNNLRNKLKFSIKMNSYALLHH